MSYDIIPGVDSSYNFPRVVREALAGSTEIKTATWRNAPPATKAELDSYITADNSGVYPVNRAIRSTLGIPNGDASGWLTVVYVHSAAVAQKFSSLTGEEFYRNYSGSVSGWTPWTPWTPGGGGSGLWQYAPSNAAVPSTKAQIDALIKLEHAGVYPVNRAVRPTLGIPAGNASGWLTVAYVNSTAVAHRFSSLTGEELYRNYTGSVSGWTEWRTTGGGGGAGTGLQARTSLETTGEWTTVTQMRSYLDEMAKHPRAKLVTIGKTVNGVDIPAVVIGDSSKPAFLAVGGQHGDELGNTHGLMVWMRQLLEGVSQLHLDMCFLIVPMLNIDNWATKRENANNADLNRDWIAFTQPETKAVRDWISGFNVIGAVDGHSFGYPRQVSMKTPTRGTTELKAKAKQLYDAIGAAVVADGQFFRTYDVANHDGMMPEGMMELGIPSLFVEIPSGYGKTDEGIKVSPNWQQRMAALTMNAAAHEVWKWTPTYPADLVANKDESGATSDTGWYDITSTLSVTPSSGRLLLRRDRNICRLAFNDLKFSSPGSGLIAVLPNGFRPEFTEAKPVSGLSKHAQVTQFGNVQLFGWVAEGLIIGSLSWATSQPLPATFPGTKL